MITEKYIHLSTDVTCCLHILLNHTVSACGNANQIESGHTTSSLSQQDTTQAALSFTQLYLTYAM